MNRTVAAVAVLGLVVFSGCARVARIAPARAVTTTTTTTTPSCMTAEVLLDGVCWPDQHCPPGEHQVKLTCVPG